MSLPSGESNSLGFLIASANNAHRAEREKSMNSIVTFPHKKRSPAVTPEMASEIKALVDVGMNQHDIAARYGINQGRVSEINTGAKFPGIEPKQLELFL